MAEETQAAASQPVPDPEALKPAGLSNAHKRYVYYGVTAALAVLILANVIGSKQSPAPMQTEANSSRAARESVPGTDPRLGEQPEAGRSATRAGTEGSRPADSPWRVLRNRI